MPKWKMKSDILIKFKSRHERLDSEYGNVSYLEWCKLEVKRIGKHVKLEFDGCQVGVVFK